MLAVLNRQLGIAVYLPRLAANGNSARGIKACIDRAEKFALHAFDVMHFGSSFLRVL